MYVWVEKREWEMVKMHTHRDNGVVILCNLSALMLRSAFARQVRVHLKTLNHFSFSSHLYFYGSGIGPSQSIESF